MEEAIVALRRAGVTVRIERDKAAQEQAIVEAVAQLYQRHRTTRPICDLLRVSGETIRRWLKTAGVPRQPRGGKRPEQTRYVIINGVRRRWQEWFPPDSWSVHDRKVLYTRLMTHGWPVERALTTPIRTRKRI